MYPFYDVIIYPLLNSSPLRLFFVRTINNENLFFVEGHSVDDILDLANVANVQMGRIYPPFNCFSLYER